MQQAAGILIADLAQIGIRKLQAMGQVMKVVNPKVAGRAEGGRVAAAVKAALAT